MYNGWHASQTYVSLKPQLYYKVLSFAFIGSYSSKLQTPEFCLRNLTVLNYNCPVLTVPIHVSSIDTPLLSFSLLVVLVFQLMCSFFLSFCYTALFCCICYYFLSLQLLCGSFNYLAPRKVGYAMSLCASKSVILQVAGAPSAHQEATTTLVVQGHATAALPATAVRT